MSTKDRTQGDVSPCILVLRISRHFCRIIIESSLDGVGRCCPEEVILVTPLLNYEGYVMLIEELLSIFYWSWYSWSVARWL